MPEDHAIHQLLAILYAAPLQPELWTRFLSGFARSLGVHAAAMVHHNLTSAAHGVHFSTGIDPRFDQLYVTRYANQDVYRPRLLRMRHRVGQVLMGDELCSVRQMRDTAFYAELLRPADIRLWLGLTTVHTDTCIESISLYHPWDSHPPDTARINTVRQMAPHINSAFRVRARLAQLEQRNRDLYTALNHAEGAIVLINRSGRCSFVNAAARQILDQRDGLIFRDHRLSATDPAQQAEVTELIRRASHRPPRGEHLGGGTMRIHRQQRPALHLRIAPFTTSPEPATDVAAIAFITSPDKGTHLPTVLLQTAYGLTPAEIRLAMLLADGNTLTHAAELLTLKKETVRSQLKSIFLKTNTRRQAELILFLTTLPQTS